MHPVFLSPFFFSLVIYQLDYILLADTVSNKKNRIQTKMSKNNNKSRKNNYQKNYYTNINQDVPINIALDNYSVPDYNKQISQNNFFEEKIKKNIDTNKKLNYIINDGYKKPLGNSLNWGTQPAPILKTECQKRSERKQIIIASGYGGKNNGIYKKTRSKIGC